MSHKVYILIDHEAPNILKAVGLTEVQAKLFKEKVKRLSLKTAKIMEDDNVAIKKSKLCETIQETFSQTEILLLATHSVEVITNGIYEQKNSPKVLFERFIRKLKE